MRKKLLQNATKHTPPPYIHTMSGAVKSRKYISSLFNKKNPAHVTLMQKYDELFWMVEKKFNTFIWLVSCHIALESKYIFKSINLSPFIINQYTN